MAAPPSAATRSTDVGLEPTVDLICIEVMMRLQEKQPEYRRLTWYSERRVLKNEIASDPDFQTTNGAELHVYATDGRLIRSIELGARGIQEDYFYDNTNNRTDYRFSYPRPPSIDMVSNDEPWLAVRNVHEYDAQGRLIATTAEAYGQGEASPRSFRRTFTEDEAGRCASTDAPDAWSSIRHQAFRYDDRSRLSELETESGEDMCGHQLARYEYDERDRVVAVRTDCEGVFRSSELHAYNADGSETVALTNELTDKPEPYRLERSPACLRIDRAIGKPDTQRCRVASDSI